MALGGIGGVGDTDMSSGNIFHYQLILLEGNNLTKSTGTFSGYGTLSIGTNGWIKILHLVQIDHLDGEAVGSYNNFKLVQVLR